MHNIKADCPSCKSIILHDDEISVTICDDKAWSFYEFVCPKCHRNVRPSASDEAIRILTEVIGITPQYWRIPKEALEAHDGPQLTNEDWTKFRADLEKLP